MLESTEKGSVRNSIRNCLTVFQNDPLLSGAIAKNLLTERVDIVKPIGYHRIGTAITDTDMNYLLLYLEETYGLTSEKKITAAIGMNTSTAIRHDTFLLKFILISNPSRRWNRSRPDLFPPGRF